MKINRSFIVFLSIAAGVVAQDKTITYYESVRPRSLDPVYGGQTVVGQRVVSLLFTPLYGLNQSMVIEPYVAENLPVEEQNSITFRIKPDMTWHDGKPVTTEDVVSTFKMLKRDDEYVGKGFLESFLQFSSSGGNTITATLNPNESYELYYLQMPVLPKHKFPTGVINKNSLFTKESPVGNGPFKIKEKGYKTNKIIFERFDQFSRVIGKKQTNIEEIILKVERDRSQWSQDLRVGQVDLLPVVPTAQIQDIKDYEGIQPVEYANYSVEMIGFNFKKPLLRELFIRRAIYYAFDRDNAIAAELDGNGQLLTGPFPAGSKYYWTEYPRYEHNPEKARALLEEKCELIDGVYYFRGQKLSFSIMGPKGNRKFEDQIRSFQKQMMSVGIEIVNPQQLDYNNFRQNLDSGDFDLAWITLTFDEALDISPVYQTDGKMNFWGYSNTRVDSKFNDLKIAKDRNVRKRIGYDIHKELHNDPPALFLWTEKRYTAYNKKKISNFKIHPKNFFQLVHEWNIRE